MPDNKILSDDFVYVVFNLNSQKAYDLVGLPPFNKKNYASVLTPCLIKLFRFCLNTSPFCRKNAYAQPAPSKGDRFNTSNYFTIVLFHAFLKLLKPSLAGNFLSINLFSDRQYRFFKRLSTNNFLAFVTDFLAILF